MNIETIVDIQHLGLFNREIWYNEIVFAAFDTKLADDSYLYEIEQDGALLQIGKLEKE